MSEHEAGPGRSIDADIRGFGSKHDRKKLRALRSRMLWLESKIEELGGAENQRASHLVEELGALAWAIDGILGRVAEKRAREVVGSVADEIRKTLAIAADDDAGYGEALVARVRELVRALELIRGDDAKELDDPASAIARRVLGGGTAHESGSTRRTAS